MSQTTFADLNLPQQMLSAIEELGFTAATDVQAETIPLIRTGVDILAQSQTGTGKTMAFAIPAVEMVDVDDRNVQVLILSPTRELAQQCGDEIRKLSRYMPHVKTADVYGGADFMPQFRALKQANMVIGTPGRVMDHMRRDSLNLSNLKMIILDEADEMLNMGFKEDIETILMDVPESRQTILFSATVPPEILAITKQFQNNPSRVNIKPNQMTLENIQQNYVEIPMFQKPEGLRLLMHYFQPKRAIVFANTKSMVDELVELLNNSGFYAQGLHGDMKQSQRTSVMQAFKGGKFSILIATDVAARGIDVSDVDFVFNFDIPKITEYYVHRIGRTGRAGRTGTAITLCCGRRQVVLMEQLGRKLKSHISGITLPSLDDIAYRSQLKNAETIEKAMETPANPAHLDMVSKLMEKGFAAEDIAATLIGMHFQQNLQGLVDLKLPTVKVTEHRGDREGRQRRGNAAFGDMVISIGSSNRVSTNHIIGAISERTGLRGKSIGRIEIYPEYTVAGVHSEQLDTVISAMEGVKICGKPVTVTPLADQPRKRNVRPHGDKKFSKPYHKGNKKKYKN